MSIVGSSSAVTIVAGLVRMKAVAMILGATGIGLLGLLQQAVAVASTLFGLGLRQSGTKEIAKAKSDESGHDLFVTRRALVLSTVILAVGGAATVFVIGLTLHVTRKSPPLTIVELAWISLAVAITIGANSQQALLNGLRQVGSIGKSSVFAAIFATALALLALFFARDFAIYLILIAAPLGSFLAGHWYVSRLPKIANQNTTNRELFRAFATMAKLGAAIMAGTLVVGGGQLVVRFLIERELGTIALGLFTSVWLISNYYITFLYLAIVTDLFPKLSEAQGDHSEIRLLINEQSGLCLMAAAPIFIITGTLAPYLLIVLYDKAFAAAALLLGMFVLGDAMKVMVLPLQFALLANGNSRQHLFIATCGTSTFVAVSALLMGQYALLGLGIAYVAMHALEFALSLIWNRKLFSFRYDAHLAIALTIFWTGLAAFVGFRAWTNPVGITIGLVLFAVSSAFFLHRFLLAHRS